MNLNALKSLRKTFDEVDEAEEVTDFLPDLPEDSVNNSSTSSYQKGVEGDVEEPIGRGPLALLELILKDPRRLDRLIREPAEQPELLFRLLAVCLVGFTFFGVSMSLVLSTTLVWPQLSAIDQVLASTHGSLIRFQGDPAANLSTPWLNGNALRLIAAYAIGLIGATGICLPSLYFYGLLAGVRMTMMDVVIHAIKSKAVAAVTLVGILPLYAAFGLAITIFPLSGMVRDAVLLLGLILPFVAGLSGTYSLYRGLSTLTDTMTRDRREYRECFLQRLVLSWSAVYSAVSPVLIFTLWQRFQG